MSRSNVSFSAMKTMSIKETGSEDLSMKSEAKIYSDRNSTTTSETSVLAIHTFLVETGARDLDREIHQDPDGDRYLSSSEKSLR